MTRFHNRAKRHTVYLAGPISGLDYNGATVWRDQARGMLEPDIHVLSPMRAKEYLQQVAGDVGFSSTCEEYQHFSPLSGPRGIMTRDRFDATRCDVLFVNLIGASKVSVGTVMEIAWADLCRTPIVCAMEPGNVHEHCMVHEAIGFRVGSVDEGVHVVRSILL